MVASDYVAIAVGAITVLTGIVAFLETLDPPETERAKRIWTGIVGILGTTAIVLMIVQVRLAARDRDLSQHAMDGLRKDLKTQNGKLATIGGKLDELKKLTQSRPDESADKVLAAAAAKILELEKASNTQETQIRSLQSRHLSDKEKIKLRAAASKLCPIAPKTSVTASNGDREAQAYGMEFVKVL